MATHVSREIRRAQIVQSAGAILEEQGLANCTMSAIAERAGITRAWLYKFFPDVESVLIALWLSWQEPGALEVEPDRTPGQFRVQVRLITTIDLWLHLSLGAALVGSYGLLGTVGGAPVNSGLNELLWSNWESRWLGPLVQSGVPRDHAVAATVVIHASTVGVLLAMHQSRLHRDEAREVLIKVVRAVTDPSWTVTHVHDS